MMPCSATRPSHSLRCSSVPPSRTGSLPRNVAKTDVPSPMSMPAIRLGDEDELYAERVAAHRAHGVLRADVLVVELEHPVLGQLGRDEVAQRLEHQVQRAEVQPFAAEVGRGGGGRCHDGFPSDGVAERGQGASVTVPRTERSSTSATSLTSTLSCVSSSCWRRETLSDSITMQNGHAAATMSGCRESASSARFSLMRWPIVSSIHIRAPPAPQQKDLSWFRGISASRRPGTLPRSSRGGAKTRLWRPR